MSKLTHPKCGKQFANASSVGHCAVCCETFVGQGAFDRHLNRDEDGTYWHRIMVEEDLWWKDSRGYWHHGTRLTEEQKLKMFPKDVDA